LTQHPVRVLSNQVVAEVVVPAAPSIRVGKNAVRYALVNAVVSTNGVTTTTARLDEIRRLAKQVPGAGVPSLVEALRDPSPTIRALAAWSLAPARDPQLVPVLRPLLDDVQDRVRAAVAWALGQTGAAEAGPLLAERVRKDPSELVRYRAVAGLGVLRLPSAVPAMAAALDDVASAVREQAAINLLPLLGKGTVPPELLKMAQSPRSATRRLALILLGRTGGDGAETALRTGLVDADAIVCAEAVLGLGRRQAAIPAADVQRLLSHADEHVRGATVHALFLLGDRSVAARLRPLLQDPHPFVRAVVADSLSRGGDATVKPPAGFSATAAFGYPF